MKKFLALILVVLTLAGCVAVPVYDDGYYYPYYSRYPYVYWGPEVSVFFVPGGHRHGGYHHYGGRR